MCCGKSNIMFSIEMVEGKDSPPQANVLDSEKGKTVRMLLLMLRSYFHAPKYIVLDSSWLLCVEGDC